MLQQHNSIRRVILISGGIMASIALGLAGIAAVFNRNIHAIKTLSIDSAKIDEDSITVKCNTDKYTIGLPIAILVIERGRESNDTDVIQISQEHGFIDPTHLREANSFYVEGYEWTVEAGGVKKGYGDQLSLENVHGEVLVYSHQRQFISQVDVPAEYVELVRRDPDSRRLLVIFSYDTVFGYDIIRIE
jgi:hypothetical protein